MEIRAYKVSKIVEYMRDLLETDMLLCSFWVEGEISNFTRHDSGHLFFSIKDDNAALRAVIFKSEADELEFEPKNGDLVRIYGRISLYKKTGELRLIGEFMTLTGTGRGDIKQNLEILKEKLLAEGIFENRRPLPRYPCKIAIVTSPVGAAIADMRKVISGKNPLIQVILVPVLVQGERAPADIAEGLRLANAQSGADVIIVGRGGGSAEDLWAFNSEEVARAVFASKIPVVSAVGHETDFSLCDFAADLRCATPTEAAAVVTPDYAEMAGIFKARVGRLGNALMNRVDIVENRLNMRVERLSDIVFSRLDFVKRDLLNKSNILEKISPMAVLRRGFAVVKDSEGVIVKQGSSLISGQKVMLQFQDTQREAEIL
jgi:exodeoxyribonuclease VII large subunit